MKRKTRIWISWMMPNGSLDPWMLEIGDDEQKILFTYPDKHLNWLHPFQTFISQYEFYALALTGDEFDEVKAMLMKRRKALPCKPQSAENKKAKNTFTKEQRQMIILKAKGEPDEVLAERTGIDIGTVRQQLKRWRQKYKQTTSCAVAQKMKILFNL